MGSAITSEDSNREISPDFGPEIEARMETLVFNITDDNEGVFWAVIGPGGLSRIEGEERRHVSCEVVMVVTERRVLFVADTPGGDVDTGALAYSELASVEVTDDGSLLLTMTDGVRWEFPLPATQSATVERAVHHLRWIGDLRGRLVACKNDIELTAGEIRDHAEAREWALATGEYESVRQTLDRTIDAVFGTEPIATDVLAPELTGMERTLEQAHTQLYIERARSKLELGRQLVESEEYGQAESVLEAAQRYYERARGCADAVERGDAFRFGEQRRLHEELDRLGWELEAVAAEPVRQAQEALVRVENASERAEAVEHLETAFRRYRNVLDIEWGEDDRYFAGDRDEIRVERTTVAERLVSCHRDLAADNWDAGVEHRDNGDIKEALRRCERATAHQARAAEIAAEFEMDAVDAIEDRQREMKETVRTIRDTAEASQSAGGDDEQSEPEHPDSSSAIGSEVDIADIDTHHEITLTTTVDDGDSSDHYSGGQQEEEDHTDSADSNGDSTQRNEDLMELTRAIIQSDPNEK